MKKILQTSGFLPAPVLILLLIFLQSTDSTAQDQPHQAFKQYKGKVVDNTGKGLPAAYLEVQETTISTVTNSEGEFSLKLPTDLEEVSVRITKMGYQTSSLPLEYFKDLDTRITLEESAQVLSEVALYTATDPEELVRNMLKKRGENYFNELIEMTAFYRESIKKRRRNVSLSEAVVKIHKQPYTSISRDNVSIVKARKSADYERLDTLALKLQGGPFNTLNLDVMKNPDFLLDVETLDNYEFTLKEPQRINNRHLYVVDFEEYDHSKPWYYGTLFIDAESLTLVKADFELNVEDRNTASKWFVKRKPGGTKVYPVKVHYSVDYRERDSKWYYGYGQAELEFVVNWRRKLFNTRYSVKSEMAITQWKKPDLDIPRRSRDYISQRIVMSDDISGFADNTFWGANNIIEPDKSIENAIEKIQQRLSVE